VEAATVLPVAADRAWERALAWEEQVRWMADADRVTVLTPRRAGAGVRLSVRTRVFGIPLFSEPLEVVAWEPPHRLVLAHRGPVRGVGTWSLAPASGGAGTRFTWTEELTLPIPVLGALALLVYRPFLRRLMRRSLSNLAALLLREPGDG
jgi:Polyketide cyclase / dehydrase and lipid transport